MAIKNTYRLGRPDGIKPQLRTLESQTVPYNTLCLSLSLGSREYERSKLSKGAWCTVGPVYVSALSTAVDVRGQVF